MRLAFFLCAWLWTVWAFAAPQPMTFSEALNRMIDADVNVRVQQTKVTSSDAQLIQAEGKFLPQISASYSQQTGGGFPDEHSYSVSGSVNLFRWGADIANLKAARRDQEFQTTTLQQTRLDAEDRAAEALLDLIEQKRTLEVYRRSESNARNYYVIAQQRFKKSFLSSQELDKVALDLSNAEAQSSDTEIKLADARAVVESLVGPVQVQDQWPWESRFTNQNVQRLLNMEGEPQFVDRPDYQAAMASVEAETQREKSTFRMILPTLDLSYSKYQGFIYGQSLGEGWATMATLNFTLFNGLQDYSAYHIQEATRYAAEYRLEQLKRDIESQQQDARKNFKISYQQYKTRVSDLSIAERILKAEATRFKMGRADANDLNLDLARVTQSQLLAIQGIHHVHSAYMRLMHAFGRQVAGGSGQE